MTEEMVIGNETDRAIKTIERAMTAFEATIATLEHAVEEFTADYKAGRKDVVGDLRLLNSAFQQAVKMEGEAREAAKNHIGGTFRAGQLDLDAARDEIGLRLACLRAAGDG